MTSLKNRLSLEGGGDRVHSAPGIPKPRYVTSQRSGQIDAVIWGLSDSTEPNSLLSQSLPDPEGCQCSQLSVFWPKGCSCVGVGQGPPRQAPSSNPLRHTTTPVSSQLRQEQRHSLRKSLSRCLTPSLERGSLGLQHALHQPVWLATHPPGPPSRHSDAQEPLQLPRSHL